MNGKIALITALALAAGCEFAEKTDYQGAGPSCVSTGGACTENADCCSYGCGPLGQCVANPLAGGACRTTNDCVFPMLCKSDHCSSTATCRDDADVCSTAGQCCSSHCDGTKCVPNNAPLIQMGAASQDVPRNQPFPIVNTSYDPDGDAVSWGWTLTPLLPPSAPGTLSATNVKNPTFNPGSTLATYRLDLDATDFWGLGASGSVTLNVVNTPPTVSPASAALVTQRNVALAVKMNVSDANGDTLGCTWSICRPGTTVGCLTAPAPLTSLPGLPASQPTAAFPVGLTSASEGTWEVSLACGDGVLTTTGTTTVTVNNTPPAIVVPATRTYNLGTDAASTPNASIAAAATDANGDPIASWSWNVLTVPTGSLVDVTDLGATAATSTAVFKPDVTGLYTFTVTACDAAASNPPWVDRPAGCSTQTVVSTVYPYIRPLGHGVGDAAFHRAASTARLVIVGPDAAAGALWDYDLIAGSAPVKTALDGVPNAVALTPDGGTAVVADPTNAYRVALGASPTKTTWTAPLSLGDVITISGSDAYVFPATPGAGAYYQHLNLSTGVFTSTVRTGTWGASVVAGVASTYLVADTYLGDLVRLRRQGNSEIFEASDTTYAGGAIWSSGSGAHVFSSDGYVYAVPDTVPSTTFGELSTTLGVSNVRHVDTSPTESVVLALANAAGEVRRYNSGFNLVAADALPHWGIVGSDRTVEGLFAFVSYDAARVHVVMRTTSGGAPEYGLYSYTLP